MIRTRKPSSSSANWIMGSMATGSASPSGAHCRTEEGLYSMPVATIRLEPWSDLNRTEFIVTFDPATITVLPSDGGCVLQVQLTISPEGHITTGPSLIAVYGMASFAIQDARAGVEIPMQSLPVNERQLRIPLTTFDLVRIEVRR